MCVSEHIWCALLWRCVHLIFYRLNTTHIDFHIFIFNQYTIYSNNLLILDKGIAEKAEHNEDEKHQKLGIFQMLMFMTMLLLLLQISYFFSNDFLLSFFIHAKEHEAWTSDNVSNIRHNTNVHNMCTMYYSAQIAFKFSKEFPLYSRLLFQCSVFGW